jgi:hypothetical protein
MFRQKDQRAGSIGIAVLLACGPPGFSLRAQAPDADSVWRTGARFLGQRL